MLKKRNYLHKVLAMICLFIKKRLAQLIEENAKQGNTAVFTVLPKHLALSEIHRLSSDLNQLGYSIRFEVKEFYYSFNIHWN